MHFISSKGMSIFLFELSGLGVYPKNIINQVLFRLGKEILEPVKGWEAKEWEAAAIHSGSGAQIASGAELEDAACSISLGERRVSSIFTMYSCLHSQERLRECSKDSLFHQRDPPKRGS